MSKAFEIFLESAGIEFGHLPDRLTLALRALLELVLAGSRHRKSDVLRRLCS